MMSNGVWRSKAERLFDRIRDASSPCEFHSCGRFSECGSKEIACQAFVVYVECGKRPLPSEPSQELYDLAMASCC